LSLQYRRGSLICHSGAHSVSSRVLKINVLFAFAFFPATIAFGQADPTSRSWNKPVPPFQIIGNLYYVGATEIGSFLITTRQGHILLDGGFVETAPQIERNIAQLGFKLEDVKILLNSHAHFDHAGGLAELKQKTGAKFIARARAAELLRSGGHGDFRFGDTLPFPPVQVDQIIGDGESIELGGQKLIALLTPGHTKGNTTWTTTISDGSKSYDVLFAGSPTNARLSIGPKRKLSRHRVGF